MLFPGERFPDSQCSLVACISFSRVDGLVEVSIHFGVPTAVLLGLFLSRNVGGTL